MTGRVRLIANTKAREKAIPFNIAYDPLATPVSVYLLVSVVKRYHAAYGHGMVSIMGTSPFIAKLINSRKQARP